MQARYNLNGLIELRINGPKKYINYFNNEYNRISDSSTKTPKTRLNINITSVSNQNYKKSLYKHLFNFKFHLDNSDVDEETINFKRHWLEYFYITPLGAYIQCQIIEPIIYRKLLQNGVLFMHAAGAEKHGSAFVFPAQGGTGKTTLSIKLMKQGYNILGDDLLMIDTKTGMVYPYARPLHLFTYNLKTLTVPFNLKIIIWCKNILRYALRVLTGEHFLISTRVHADQIMDVKFGAPSKLSRIVFLKREGEDESLTFDQDANLEYAAQAIIDSADLNDSLEENFGYSNQIRTLENNVVRDVLKHVSKIDFVNPRKFLSDTDYLRFSERLSTPAP